uniref:Uncharacterized protein n=1 Tax=Maylandia zebra TaxID=106582 RepID=A0A3P9AZF8_9CICH
MAEDGRSRKRRQTHEKEDPASSIMRFLWVCLCPGGEEGSATTALRCWRLKTTELHCNINSAETTRGSLLSQYYLHFE